MELDQLGHSDSALLLQRVAETAEWMEKFPTALGGCQKGQCLFERS
jgi:hypothetical protein